MVRKYGVEKEASALSRSVEKAALSSVNIVSGKEEDLDVDLKNDQKGLGLVNILTEIEFR